MAEKTLEQLQAENAELRKQIEKLQRENDALSEAAEARGNESKREQAIAKKIAESGGSLSRDQAILALDNQAAHDAQKKGAAKK